MRRKKSEKYHKCMNTKLTESHRGKIIRLFLTVEFLITDVINILGSYVDECTFFLLSIFKR